MLNDFSSVNRIVSCECINHTQDTRTKKLRMFVSIEGNIFVNLFKSGFMETRCTFRINWTELRFGQTLKNVLFVPKSIDRYRFHALNWIEWNWRVLFRPPFAEQNHDESFDGIFFSLRFECGRFFVASYVATIESSQTIGNILILICVLVVVVVGLTQDGTKSETRIHRNCRVPVASWKQ